MGKSNIGIIGTRSVGSWLISPAGLGGKVVGGRGLSPVLLLILVLHEIVAGCNVARSVTVLLSTARLGLLGAIALLATTTREYGLREGRGSGRIGSV